MNKYSRKHTNIYPYAPMPAKVKTGFFCCRNNGSPKNKPKAGSVRYAAKHGLPGHEYDTHDRCYRQPPKLKSLSDRLIGPGE